MFVLIVLLIGCITALTASITWRYTYWKRKKVPGPEPSLFFGNIGSTLSFQIHAAQLYERWYKRFPNVPYIGYYKMMTPGLVLCDPDIIKKVLIKDQFSFQKNDFDMSEKVDPVLSMSPIFRIGDEWRFSRKTIEPALTPNRVKLVFPLMETCAEKLVEFVKYYKSKEDIEARALTYRYTVQSNLMTGFSIDARCFDHHKTSEFVIIGKNAIEGSFWACMKFVAYPFMPKWLIDLIPIPFMPKEMNDLFHQLVMGNKKSRAENDDSNDIFQKLIQSQKKHDFSDLLLTSHAVSFFYEGTETSGLALMFTLYELAKNQECQERLYVEICEKIERCGDQLTYEAFQEIEYLEWVVLEALRIHPTLMAMLKVCTEKYTLPRVSEDAEPLTIYPGTPIQIPILALHMDPRYFPEPEKFIPERFTAEEQSKRHKGVYLPFGEGPRICLGMRFGMVQVKAALMHLVKNFRATVSPNHTPFAVNPKGFMRTPVDGILLNFEQRTN